MLQLLHQMNASQSQSHFCAKYLTELQTIAKQHGLGKHLQPLVGERTVCVCEDCVVEGII